MGLPRIAPYPMPDPAALPEPRIAWTIEPHRAALLVHDMQAHFLAAFDAEREPVPALVANVAALAAACRAAGVPVLYSAQPPGQTPEQRGLLQDVWGDGIPAGTGAEAILDAVAPRPGEEVITKWRYSALVRTDLAARLRALGRDQLIVCGIYAHIGVIMTAAHAFMEDIRSVIAADAVADFSAEQHRAALAWAGSCTAGIAATADLIAQIGAGADATGPAGVDLERMRADVLAALDDPPAALGDDDDLIDLGLDSIRVMALLNRWREAGLPLSAEDLIEAEPTLGGWWAAAQEAAARAGAR